MFFGLNYQYLNLAYIQESCTSLGRHAALDAHQLRRFIAVGFRHISRKGWYDRLTERRLKIGGLNGPTFDVKSLLVKPAEPPGQCIPAGALAKSYASSYTWSQATR